MAVLAQPLTGFLLMREAGWALTSAWFAWVAILFVATGLCWLPVVWLQYRLRNCALHSASTGQPPTSFYREFLIWFALGLPAFAMVLVLYWLMVAKPGL